MKYINLFQMGDSRYIHSLSNLSSAKLDGKIKCSLDYVNMVIQIAENIMAWDDSEDECTVALPYLIVTSGNKHQRVYIVKSDQIVSFAFPFSIYCKECGNDQKKWRINYRDIEITEPLLSKCRELYTDLNDYRDGKTFAEISSDWVPENDDIRKAVSVFESIVLMEPGYIRFDNDPQGAKGHIHPINHLDMNFNHIGHYKIGLHNKLSHKNLEDIMRIDTNCWYLTEYSKIDAFRRKITLMPSIMKRKGSTFIRRLKRKFVEVP